MSFFKKLGTGLSVIIAASAIAFIGPHIKSSFYRHHIGSDVVKISVGKDGKEGTGTGFHVKAPSGITYILTNNHICEGAFEEKVLVQEEGTGREIPRRVIQKFKNHDLCLVEALPGHTSALKVAKSLEYGEDVVLIGHPNGRPLVIQNGEYLGNKIIRMANPNIESEEDCNGEWEESLMSILAFGRPAVCIEQFNSSQISSITYPGNSGSPVVNKWGRVIGVLFAGNGIVNDGYTVPLQAIKTFLKDY